MTATLVTTVSFCFECLSSKEKNNEEKYYELIKVVGSNGVRFIEIQIGCLGPSILSSSLFEYFFASWAGLLILCLLNLYFIFLRNKNGRLAK